LLGANTVESEQLQHVALPEADPSQFHAADLGGGCVDRPAGCGNRDFAGVAEWT
jgi:hypothetical protein